MINTISITDAAAELLGHADFSVQYTTSEWWLTDNNGDGQTPAFTQHYAAIAARADQLAGPTTANVIAERERRLAAGFDFDFADVRGVHRMGTTPADMLGWDEVTKLASAMLVLDDSVSTITIVTDTGPTAVTALEWQAVLVAAGAFRQPIWQASFILQNLNPIPGDYADDSYWP